MGGEAHVHVDGSGESVRKGAGMAGGRERGMR